MQQYQNLDFSNIANQAYQNLQKNSCGPALLNFYQINMLNLPNSQSSKRSKKKTKDSSLEDGQMIIQKVKMDLIQWIKQLDIEEKFNLLMIQDDYLIGVIQKLYWKSVNSGETDFAMSKEMFNHEFLYSVMNEPDESFICSKNIDTFQNNSKMNASAEMIQNLIIINDSQFYDSLCFKEEFIKDIDNLLNLFDIISDKNIFCSPCKLYWNNEIREYAIDSPMWFNPKSFQSLSNWIVSQMEKAIQIRYHHYKNQKYLNNQLINPSENYSFFVKKQLLVDFWLTIDKQNKKKIQMKAQKEIIELGKQQLENDKLQNFRQNKYLKFYTSNKADWIDKDLTVNYYFKQQFEIDSNKKDFIESLYQTTLNQTNSLLPLIQYIVLQKINEFYTDQIANELINTEEKKKKSNRQNQKKKKKLNTNTYESITEKKQQNNNNSQENKQINKIEKVQENQSNNDLVDNMLKDSKDDQISITSPNCFSFSTTGCSKSQSSNSDYITPPNSPVAGISIQQNLSFLLEKNEQQSKSQDKTKQSKSNVQNFKVSLDDGFIQVKNKKQTKQCEQSKALENFKIKKLSKNKKLKQNNTDIKQEIQQPQIIKQMEVQKTIEKDIQVEKQETNYNQIETKKLKLKQKISLKEVEADKYEILPIKNNKKTKIMDFEQKLNFDIISFVDSSTETSLKYMNLRIIIFRRIQFIIQMLFKDADAKIFGSCATGLALTFSDIDIGIIGLDAIVKQDVEFYLTILHDNLKNLKWVTNHKSILTAAIPVLKLEIDPFIDFTGFDEFLDADQRMNMLIMDPDEYPPQNRFAIKVDITVESNLIIQNFSMFQDPNCVQEHLGSISTDLMNEWLDFYPSLFDITIFIKSFLCQKQYNDTYKGGISSYCILILIIAYLRKSNQIFSENRAEVLIGFLDFYGNNFQPNLMGINLNLKENPFFDIPNTEPLFKVNIYDPLNPIKNLTKNAYQFKTILLEFQAIHSYLKTMQAQYLQDNNTINYNIINNYLQEKI